MSAKRIGVYGGTFSPPHIGHVHAARHFLRAMKLDRLLIIPSFLPPHKTVAQGASADDRLAMAQLAFGHLLRTEISDIEIRRGGLSYTADTLSALAKDGDELFLLVGTDMFLTLGSWHDPQTIFRLATVCYIRRECDDAVTAQIAERTAQYERTFGARIVRIDAEPLPLSSSDVRSGDAAEGALPDTVRRYIEERGLYRCT